MSLSKYKLNAMRASLDDIQKAIASNEFKETIYHENYPRDYKSKIVTVPVKRSPPYIKVTLRKTEDLLLYEQRSVTALRDSDEGKLVEDDNKQYDYLTVGKGRRRCTTNAETQTTTVLFKTRDVNTETIVKDHVGSYVSNFEMFDTYKDLEPSTKTVEIEGGTQKLEITTYKVGGMDTFIEINRQANFKLALMLAMRILAGNVFEKQQRRFRNMRMPDPLAIEVCYEYRLQLLWRFIPPMSLENERKAVADMSWCPHNGDILAVAYGIYTFSVGLKMPQSGCLCVWNIKNPVNPERSYQYSVPVVSVEFSPFVPQLLAVGLYDGSVQVLNIMDPDDKLPVAVSQQSTSPSFEPVTAIKWLSQREDTMQKCDIEPFLTLSRDGSVTKYRIINSPHLLGYRQIWLERIEGNPEGLSVERETEHLQANRHPLGLNLCLNPIQSDIYYVLTDEGCVHKCSINYPQQHLEVYQVHIAAVNVMTFSPWSPKLFLTCGNDWCIHIWMEGIVNKPIITLKHKTGPIHYANWSKTHATIIVSINRETIDVWDIKRSILKPVSSTAIDTSDFHTLFKFSNCGRSVAVGNEAGNVLILSFEDMPIPAHYQYEQLEKAIFKATATNKDLKRAVKSVGHFGYPEEKQTSKK